MLRKRNREVETEKENKVERNDFIDLLYSVKVQVQRRKMYRFIQELL